MMLRSWKGNHRFGVALAMRHRVVYAVCGFKGFQDKEMSSYACGPLYCVTFIYLPLG